MPFYNFKKDYAVANKTEEEISAFFKNIGYTSSRNNDYRYDLEIVKNDVRFTVEIKEDFTCKRTDNVGVEFGCRGRPSGIEVSEADFYLYKIHTYSGIKFRLIKTSVLKQLIVDKKYHRIVSGGDEGSNSMNYLFHLHVFINNSEDLYSTQLI